MKKIELYIFVVILLFAFSTTVQVSGKFTIEHVHFIQSASTNFLFRGGIPNEGNTFEYDDLVGQLLAMAQTEGNLTLPAPFLLFDFNLLDPNSSDDRPDIATEQDYYKQHPETGTFIQYPILGEKVDPFTLPESEVKQKAVTFDQWSVDRLPTFIEKIRGILSTPSMPPVVGYIHCQCGCDRTGEVSGSYYMAYMNMSLHDAHELDMKIAGREITNENHYALNWYCFYLKYGRNYTISCSP